ncbi:MAG: SRPBCC family protein [Acetatifactor muris]|nr:SRPBCC family protein [Acetatifactor muris]MCM1525625.1 SRPBCC family protein [Bacteroides sp.]
MAVSEIKALFSANVQEVWNIVTSLENYQWRSDISRIEILSDKQFVEYTKDGFSTTFTVTVCEPYKRWEFDMENSNMRGHWTGVFVERDSQTEIIFTEDVTARKLIMKPFVKLFLRKQQEQYISDLQKAIL